MSQVSDAASAVPVDAESARERAGLVRMRLDALTLPAGDAKRLILRELDIAEAALGKGHSEYASELRMACQAAMAIQQRRSRFRFSVPDSNIGTLLAGVLVYAVIVGMIAPCVIVVASLNDGATNAFTRAADALGLMPVFATVRSLGIQPVAYMWGIWGAAGAVVSMVKRFDQFASRRAPKALLFSEGLFNPIVGSLAAVVACVFVYRGDQLNILKPVPSVVLAFFAGFSERLLDRIESLINGRPERSEPVNPAGSRDSIPALGVKEPPAARTSDRVQL